MSTMNDNKKLSLWNIFPSEPLYILIPNLFFIRPIRFIFNYYIKPAKFLVIILPRNIWQKGKSYIYIYRYLLPGTSWLRLSIDECNICRESFCIFIEYDNHSSVANLKDNRKDQDHSLEKETVLSFISIGMRKLIR